MFHVEVADDAILYGIEYLHRQKLVAWVLVCCAEPDRGYAAPLGVPGGGVEVFGGEGDPEGVLAMEDVWNTKDGTQIGDFVTMIKATNVGKESTEDRARHGGST